MSRIKKGNYVGYEEMGGGGGEPEEERQETESKISSPRESEPLPILQQFSMLQDPFTVSQIRRAFESEPESKAIFVTDRQL